MRRPSDVSPACPQACIQMTISRNIDTMLYPFVLTERKQIQNPLIFVSNFFKNLEMDTALYLFSIKFQFHCRQDANPPR